jgi:hypothetical protein
LQTREKQRLSKNQLNYKRKMAFLFSNQNYNYKRIIKNEEKGETGN